MPAAGRNAIQLDVKGLPQLRAKLADGGAPLYGEAMTAVMESIGGAGERLARANSPIRTGRLRSSIRHKLGPKAGAFPLYVEVTASATATKDNPGGKRRNRKTGRMGRPWHAYRYPRRLEYEAGNHWYLWMTHAIEQVQPEAESLLSVAAREIELKWAASAEGLP